MQFVFSNPFLTFIAAVVMAVVAMMVVNRFFPIQVLAFLERHMDKTDRKAIERKANHLTLKGSLAGIGVMLVACSLCWVLVFIAGMRPMNWLAGSELDANQSYLAMIVTVGLIGASLHGCWYSLFRKS